MNRYHFPSQRALVIVRYDENSGESDNKCRIIQLILEHGRLCLPRKSFISRISSEEARKHVDRMYEAIDKKTRNVLK